jgi:hypothetical protein
MSWQLRISVGDNPFSSASSAQLMEETKMADAAAPTGMSGEQSAMLAQMTAAQKEAEAYQLAAQLATLKHDTIMAMIRNIK